MILQTKGSTNKNVRTPFGDIILFVAAYKTCFLLQRIKCLYPLLFNKLMSCRGGMNTVKEPEGSGGFLFKLVKAAFAQRRKTLLNCLSSGFSKDKQELSDVLISVGIEPTIRGEKLGLSEFAKIADAFFDNDIL